MQLARFGLVIKIVAEFLNSHGNLNLLRKCFLFKQSHVYHDIFYENTADRISWLYPGTAEIIEEQCSRNDGRWKIPGSVFSGHSDLFESMRHAWISYNNVFFKVGARKTTRWRMNKVSTSRESQKARGIGKEWQRKRRRRKKNERKPRRRARCCSMPNKSQKGYPHSNHCDNGERWNERETKREGEREGRTESKRYNWDERWRTEEEETGRRIRRIPEGEGRLISFLLYQREIYVRAKTGLGIELQLNKTFLSRFHVQSGLFVSSLRYERRALNCATCGIAKLPFLQRHVSLVMCFLEYFVRDNRVKVGERKDYAIYEFNGNCTGRYNEALMKCER